MILWPETSASRTPAGLFHFLQLGGDLVLVFLLRLLDARVEIVPLLEIDVDDVIPADRAGQRNDGAGNVDARQLRDFARLGLQPQGDLFEVFQFIRQLAELAEEGV